MRLPVTTISLCVLAGVAPAAASTVLPDFTLAEFDPGAPIDNPYFPLAPGYSASFSASGIDDEGEPFRESSQLRYGGAGPTILGVATTVMRDLAYEDGLLVEDTFDYFAQDRSGNVWYFGEDVTNFVYDDDDVLLSTNSESAWIAGQNDAKPGYIMPADPQQGFSYFQEFAEADEALDQAEIWSIGGTVENDGVVYSDVLVTLETNPFEPDSREFKYYAPGIGLVRIEEGLDAQFGNPELVFTRDATPAQVPVPPSLPLLAAGLAALAALRRGSVSRWTGRVSG